MDNKLLNGTPRIAVFSENLPKTANWPISNENENLTRGQIVGIVAEFLQGVLGDLSKDWAIVLELPGGRRLRLACEHHHQGTAAGSLGPFAQEIVSVCSSEPMIAKRIAAKLGRKNNSYVRVRLAELVRRGVLRHTPDGYCLA
jgi:hypothetical protein